MLLNVGCDVKAVEARHVGIEQHEVDGAAGSG